MKAKSCPFCGGDGEPIDPETRSVISLDPWSKRPIEDRLSAERDEALARCKSLEADIERLRDKLKMAKEVWEPLA